MYPKSAKFRRLNITVEVEPLKYRQFDTSVHTNVAVSVSVSQILPWPNTADLVDGVGLTIINKN